MSFSPRKKPSRWPAMPEFPSVPGGAVPSMWPTARSSVRSSVPGSTGTSSRIFGIRSTASGAGAGSPSALRHALTRRGDHERLVRRAGLQGHEPERVEAVQIVPRRRWRRQPGTRPTTPGRPGRRPTWRTRRTTGGVVWSWIDSHGGAHLPPVAGDCSGKPRTGAGDGPGAAFPRGFGRVCGFAVGCRAATPSGRVEDVRNTGAHPGTDRGAPRRSRNTSPGRDTSTQDAANGTASGGVRWPGSTRSPPICIEFRSMCRSSTCSSIIS